VSTSTVLRRTEIRRPTRRPFLTAQWVNMILANFPVPDELLTPYLPPGLELDRFEGRAYVSIVAFEFRDTRVFGVRWPGYRDFPEINLRFYARAGEDRGVVFIREYAPSRVVAWIARRIYNERYKAVPVKRQVTETAHTIRVEDRLFIDGRENVISATGRKPGIDISPGGMEEFLRDLRWGFGTDRRGRCTRFLVEHPDWRIFPVQNFFMDWSWSKLYGPRWSLLQCQKPESVVFAGGSEISVFPRQRVALAAESD